MTKFKKIVIGLILLIIAIPLATYGYIYYKLNSIYVPDETTQETVEKEELKEEKEDDITNIMLVGVDGQNLDKGNRSDSMMIMTIDKKHNSVKLTSLARDTYVDIPGYSTEKLTHAYAYEGPSLLLQTVEENMGLDIDKYITVNFASFMNIIDIIGGVEVEVEAKDVNEINKYIDASYPSYDDKNGIGKKYIQEPGLQTLNGYQALGFCRIRYTDSAFARDERQREVVQSAITKLQSQGLDKYISIIDEALINVKTNISPTEMIGLGNKVLKMKDMEMKSLEFPIYKQPDNLPGKGYIIKWDKESNLQILNDFIFNDKEHTE